MALEHWKDLETHDCIGERERERKRKRENSLVGNVSEFTEAALDAPL